MVTCGNADPGASTPEVKAPSFAPAPATLEVVGFELRGANGKFNSGGNHYARGRIPWLIELRGAEPKVGKFTVGLETKIFNVEGRVRRG